MTWLEKKTYHHWTDSQTPPMFWEMCLKYNRYTNTTQYINKMTEIHILQNMYFGKYWCLIEKRFLRFKVRQVFFCKENDYFQIMTKQIKKLKLQFSYRNLNEMTTVSGYSSMFKLFLIQQCYKLLNNISSNNNIDKVSMYIPPSAEPFFWKKQQ